MVDILSDRGEDNPNITAAGQYRWGWLLVLEEQSEGRRSRVFPLAGLPDAPLNLLYMGGPGSALHEQMVVRLSLAAATPPTLVQPNRAGSISEVRPG